MNRHGAGPLAAPRAGLLARLVASRAEIDAQDEREAAARHDASPIRDARARARVRCAGILTAVTYRPRDGVVSLRARLYDGSGSIDLVWLGRREIPGIEAGRRLVAEGIVFGGADRPTIFNPAYELLGQDA
ncbi:OB-fold nucleic acid binding domain-containing protein [Georgenia faecalis]|uniref:OB-fold nucleic acid binding domain-containing protein n=1 Tax=Georgenia faecalis TaxID=2483799 RepID=A0ABV9DCY2_9MICO|nr:OB-fold nucleic acid binding domain-containing protein [Georgenia faecalis]